MPAYQNEKLSYTQRITSAIQESFRYEKIDFDTIESEDDHYFTVRTTKRYLSLETLNDLYYSIASILELWMKIKIDKNTMNIISDRRQNILNISFNIHQ